MADQNQGTDGASDTGDGGGTRPDQGGGAQGGSGGREQPADAPVETEESGAGYGNNAGQQGLGSAERADETDD